MLATVSRSLSRFRRQSQGIRRSTAAGFAGCKVHVKAKSLPAVSIPLKGLVQEGGHLFGRTRRLVLSPAPSQVIAVEEFLSTPGSLRSRTASAKPSGHPNLYQFRFCQAVRVCVLADVFFFVGNNGNTGNNLMNIGSFCSQALGKTGNKWEQVSGLAVGTDLLFPVFPIAGPALGTLEPA